LTKLSPVDKYPERDNIALERLLDLDGQIMEVGGGCWAEFAVKRVPPCEAKPHGIDYGLCLLAPDGTRLVGYDNAHPVRKARGRKMADTNDHRHKGKRVRAYSYVDAETLMFDFWADVELALRGSSIP